MKLPLKQFLSLIFWLILIIFPNCSHNKGVVQDVSPAEANDLIKSNSNNPSFIILDVRTPGEFASGHIRGAKNIDINADDFNTQIAQMDNSKTYLVYCNTGHRSSRAVSVMKNTGFTSLKNPDGGISDWAAANLPVFLE
jgi:rhodanese-related sulfurtransferase